MQYYLIRKKDNAVIYTSSSERSILVSSDHLKMINGEEVHIIKDENGREYERQEMSWFHWIDVRKKKEKKTTQDELKCIVCSSFVGYMNEFTVTYYDYPSIQVVCLCHECKLSNSIEVISYD